MTTEQLQDECERGQTLMMQMQYLEAEAILASAEHVAWASRDWDTLARIYMPLQEVRRQRRQRAGEGVVCLDLISNGPDDVVDGRHVVENFSHGQLLTAGWGTVEPAARVRELAEKHQLYLDTFLSAVFPTDGGRVVAIIPHAWAKLPTPTVRSLAELSSLLPAHAVVLREEELPVGSRPGTYETYGQVMALWERLHGPMLIDAEKLAEPIQRMGAYRSIIAADYACELAHQRLSDVAKKLKRG